MKAINFIYEVDGESLRAYAIPSGEGYTLDFLREEDAPTGSKELYSACPVDSLFYSLDSLLKGTPSITFPSPKSEASSTSDTERVKYFFSLPIVLFLMITSFSMYPFCKK